MLGIGLNVTTDVVSARAGRDGHLAAARRGRDDPGPGARTRSSRRSTAWLGAPRRAVLAAWRERDALKGERVRWAGRRGRRRRHRRLRRPAGRDPRRPRHTRRRRGAPAALIRATASATSFPSTTPAGSRRSPLAARNVNVERAAHRAPPGSSGPRGGRTSARRDVGTRRRRDRRGCAPEHGGAGRAHGRPAGTAPAPARRRGAATPPPASPPAPGSPRAISQNTTPETQPADRGAVLLWRVEPQVDEVPAEHEEQHARDRRPADPRAVRPVRHRRVQPCEQEHGDDPAEQQRDLPRRALVSDLVGAAARADTAALDHQVAHAEVDRRDARRHAGGCDGGAQPRARLGGARPVDPHRGRVVRVRP